MDISAAKNDTNDQSLSAVGIVLARFGLWLADLSITQILQASQENLHKQEQDLFYVLRQVTLKFVKHGSTVALRREVCSALTLPSNQVTSNTSRDI